MCTQLLVSSGCSVSTYHRNVDCYYKEHFASMKNWIHKYRSQHSSYYTFKRRPFQPDEISQTWTWVPMLTWVLQEGIVIWAKSKANLEQAEECQLEVKNEEKNEALDEISPAWPSRTWSHTYLINMGLLDTPHICTHWNLSVHLCPTLPHYHTSAFRGLSISFPSHCPQMSSVKSSPLYQQSTSNQSSSLYCLYQNHRLAHWLVFIYRPSLLF